MAHYEVGTAKVDITPDLLDVTMLGWGDPAHRVKSVRTPLYARAITVQAGDRRMAFLCLDICFISELLRREVVRRLGIKEESLVITATHTHSAPGGYTADVLYDLPSDGFVPEILETYVEGSVRAVRKAFKSPKSAEIRFVSGKFSPEAPVAFNRALRAWNRNPETPKYTKRDRHLAVDREMTLLRFDDLEGRPLAALNWFPVHATSIHRDRYEIHSDNKGVAAEEMERQVREAEGVQDFVAIFAQGAAGDVSPNFQKFFGMRENRGVYRDDEASCSLNAKLQVDQAMKLFDAAEMSAPLTIRLRSIFEFHDFSRLGPAEIGYWLLYGTEEGRGLPLILVWISLITIRVSQLLGFFRAKLRGLPARWPWTDDPVQGNKITLMECGKSRAFGYERIEKLIFPNQVSPIVATIKRWGRIGVFRQRPLSPHVLPLQIIQLGDLALLAVPAEFTTVAGWRLRSTVEAAFPERGEDKIRRAIVFGYCNGYCGYVVTPEEYPVQGYEAACTHFGRFTLNAYLSAFTELSQKLIQGVTPNGLRPIPPKSEYVRAISRPSAVSEPGLRKISG